MQSKYALISSNLLVNENFQITWNKPISSLFSKSHVLQKIITDEWVYFQYFLRYLRNFKKPTFNTLLRNLMKVSVGFSKRYGTWSCLPLSGFVNLYTAWLWPSLNLLEDYLSNHKKRIKVDSFISSWEDILSGVLQGFCSIRAMFLILKTVYFNGYANDNTCFVVTGKIKDLIRHLEEVAGNIISFLQIKWSWILTSRPP